MNNPYQKYQELSVQTATPIQLVVMLYDGAIRFTKQAIEDIGMKNYEGANRNICKAQSIIHEFIASLNQEVPLSQPLLQIYDYVLHLLIQANVNKDSKMASEAIEHLHELRESWRQLSKQSIANISMSSVGSK